MRWLPEILCAAFLFAGPVLAQGEKVFSLPFDMLREWSQTVLVSFDQVKILGNSGVHELANDCEIHFGASAGGFNGDPGGLVLEPMNACVQPFPGAVAYRKADWTTFARSLRNKTVKAEGVPRIWPEHLEGEESPSNPNHALELHPLTRITAGGKEIDFSRNIFAPEGYRGGVGDATARKIVEETTVGTTRKGDSVEIDFDAGRIGNFTTIEVRIPRDTIEDVHGSHRMNSDVVFERNHSVPVRLVTVKGSAINDRIAKIKSGSRRSVRMELLVLFSLSPEAIYKAAAASQGGRVAVERPLQLIVYGVPESE